MTFESPTSICLVAKGNISRIAVNERPAFITESLFFPKSSTFTSTLRVNYKPVDRSRGAALPTVCWYYNRFFATLLPFGLDFTVV